MHQEPIVEAGEVPFVTVRGTFYRAVDPEFREFALSGSRSAGRYSSAGEPTLYLSSSPEGVAAAMVAHAGNRAAGLELMRIEAEAPRIVDLRDPAALDAAGIRIEDAIAPWQDVVERGGRPSSWDVRARLLDLGATGLIDPSRKAPGLWHLTLFAWNGPGSARVAVIEEPPGS